MIIIEVIQLATRMERYYKSNNHTSKRSDRNQHLYHEIYEGGEYSNIEGIATIEKSNEVDITKIKNMLKNREAYQKQRKFRQMVVKPEVVEKPNNSELGNERNYDIRDILDKAKSNKTTEEKYHRLDDTGYNILKKLKEKSLQTNESKDELRELIDTITNNSELNQLATEDLSLDVLNDLKSDENTVIENKDSVKALLEDAKQEEIRRNLEKEEMDKSFYTSSLNFGENDFEQLSNLNHNLKRNNILIKILVTILLVAIAGGIIFLIYTLLK